MIERHEYNKVTWIDVVNPTIDEMRGLVEECAIPPEFGTDLTTMTPRSEALAVKGALKITLDFPIVKRTDISHPHEIKFIATPKYLVTVRFESIETIHRFSKEFEVSSILSRAGANASGGHLCMSLLDRLYRAMTVKLDYLESKMTDIEEMIFESREREMVSEISNVNRRLISFQQTLYLHEEVLEEMESAAVIAFGKSYLSYVNILQDEYRHQLRRIRSLTHTLNELRSTNDSLLTTKQNEVMKTFTILAFITFPLTLFTSMFGMNTVATPLVGNPWDFWLILGIMAIVSVSFFVYFKYKRWI